METEKIICEVTPSQILNLRAFIYSFIAAVLITAAAILTHLPSLAFLLALPLSLCYALWKWLQINSIKLKLTDQRIILCEGVLTKQTNETELYRVRDSSVEEPFFYRIAGCGNITIYTTDEADATLRLRAYKKPHRLKDQVRNYAESCRQRKRWGNDNVLIQETHPSW